jgi:hypothetical protein
MIVGAVSFLGNIVVQAYFYGRLTKTVENNDGRLEKVEDEQKIHSDKISELHGDMRVVKGKLGLHGGA